MLDSRNLLIHRLEYKIVFVQFRLARAEQYHALHEVHSLETMPILYHQQCECQKVCKFENRLVKCIIKRKKEKKIMK